MDLCKSYHLKKNYILIYYQRSNKDYETSHFNSN